jgi:phenylalanyl-tRNA synthetase beta chain
MNVSLNWLKNYIDLDLPVEEISQILTAIGLEVEGVKEVESIPGGLAGLVVGNVIECGQHPNADRLSLTKVDVGGEAPLQIVCGAPNVAAGQKVIVATIGTTLYPTTGEPFKIKKGKIRGELSEGMICAEDEIGLGSGHDGIIVLPEETKTGATAAEIYNLSSDHVFDIGLTPNRSDATSHLGVAKDLAAYLKINHEGDTNVKSPDVGSFSVEHESYPIEVEVENTTSCPRFSGVTLSNIVVKASPEWMQKSLNAIGVRPINNVVDITNYVLHEIGQPLHAYDADKIAGSKIIVKNLPKDTVFKSLDEQDRKLHEDDLMICDGQSNAMCIGGVFGGANSGVTDHTKNIFLEAAYFEAGTIRRSSTRHLLRTDAAKVFEKGADPNNTIYALKRAANLLVEYAEATIASEIVDLYPQVIHPLTIHVRYDKINDLIGDNISKEEVHDILYAMDMEIKPVDDHSIQVMVPTNKADVIREVDVIEEILRIYGFNKVAIPDQISSTIQFSSFPEKNYVKNLLADFLSSNGWNEMMGLSLVESRKAKDLITLQDEELVYINNTSNIHLDIMRPDMMTSGLISVLHNQNYQLQDIRLYEYGSTYHNRGDGSFIEVPYLTLFLKGKKNPESWRNASENTELSDLQQTISSSLTRIGLRNYMTAETNDDSRFDYAIDYKIHNNTIIRTGLVSQAILKKMGIKESVYYAEIQIDKLVKAARKAKNQVSEINKFPVSRRDLALVIDKNKQFAEIVQIARKVDKKILKDVSLFDIYENEEQLGAGKKSYAVQFMFEDPTKTLKDKEIEKVMNKLSSEFESKMGAHIRK